MTGPSPHDVAAARALISRFRRTRGPMPDIVAFTASCPGCHLDAVWVNSREDTRVRIEIRCPTEDCAG